MVLEEFKDNDFIADFYLDKRRWALHFQLWFMSARIPALSLVRQSSSPVVSDYSSRKDALFARMLLDERELRLFDRVARLAARDLEKPDVIVVLDADTQTLLDRIRKRGRRYELSINASYLNELRQAYEEDLSESGMNVIRYDTSSLNLESPAEMTLLFETIESALPLTPSLSRQTYARGRQTIQEGH